MNFNSRVKVLGESLDSLTSKGFAVNAHDCKAGEYWVVGSSRSQLERDVKRHKLTTVSQYETIRG